MKVNGLFRYKAAMFGLDARISLAIFGALSIITGAAIYNTITKVKSTVALNDFIELEKAVEQYHLDTGTFPDCNAGSYNALFVGDLLRDEKSKPNWKGPYLSGNAFTYLTPTSMIYKLNGTNVIAEIDLKSASTKASCNPAITDCFIWVEYHCTGDQKKAICGRIFDPLVDSLGSSRIYPYTNSEDNTYYNLRTNIPYNCTY